VRQLRTKWSPFRAVFALHKSCHSSISRTYPIGAALSARGQRLASGRQAVAAVLINSVSRSAHLPQAIVAWPSRRSSDDELSGLWSAKRRDAKLIVGDREAHGESPARNASWEWVCAWDHRTAGRVANWTPHYVASATEAPRAGSTFTHGLEVRCLAASMKADRERVRAVTIQRFNPQPDACDASCIADIHTLGSCLAHLQVITFEAAGAG